MTVNPNQPGRHSATLHMDAGNAPEDAAVNDGVKANTAGSWRIRTEIARGGMGIVFLAFDHTLNRFLAVKRLAVGGPIRDTLRARFLREARAMAALNHIHICRIYAVGEDDAGPFIAMEYIAGPAAPEQPDLPPPPFSLENLVNQHGPLTQTQTMELIDKISGAVAYAHRNGVIHRDLKPANVLIDEQGEPRIVDFGLASMRQAYDECLTLVGDKLLSLGYGAPEQEQDASSVDQRADVYALGGMVYFCLTGESPRFYRDHRVPENLREPMLKALEQDRDQRWPSVETFIQGLKGAIRAGDLPVPGRDGWLCKWCHALNAINERYCNECGWDGMILCPACNAPMQFGIRHCPSCHADLRAFEDAAGLLDLLRDLRRGKQFERLLEKVREVDLLHAKGAVNDATFRQIGELRQNAAWALKRKEDLRQAIAVETEAENYERIRELLNEYDVIDNGDTYGDLRALLPGKIAARHIDKLRQRLQTACAFMQQKKLASCRAMMNALRDQQHRIVAMTETIPRLRQGATTLPPPVHDKAPPEDPAALLSWCNAAIDQLEHDLVAEEKSIHEWTTEAENAFRLQDYDQCIRLCNEAETLTSELIPAMELRMRATEASRTVGHLLRSAEQALADRQWRQSEELAHSLTTEWKANHPGARKILDSLNRRRRNHRLQLSAALLITAILFYLLAWPPVMHWRGIEQPIQANDTVFFRPAIRLYKVAPLSHYARLWDNHQRRR